MPTQPLQLLMLAVGIAAAFIGLLIARTRGSERFNKLSQPTRVVIGLCLAIVGYHLIVWVFPPALTPLQVSRQFWWVLLIAAVAIPLLSLATDRLVGGPESKSAAPPDASNDATDAIR